MISQVLGLNPDIYKGFKNEEKEEEEDNQQITSRSPAATIKYSERLIQGIKLTIYLCSYAISSYLHVQNDNDCFHTYSE